MTQEEKAKAYDEALERASKLRFQNPFDTVSQMMEHIFPELKESEDERIRKSIIAIINNYVDNSNTFKPKMIAWLEMQGKEDSSIQQAYKQGYIEGQRIERKCWLEKQGQQKYIPKYKIGDYVKNTNYKGEPIYEIIYMDKECYICEYRGKEEMGDKTVMHFSFDNPYLRLVQKSDDKVEPKFHEGEWIVDSQGFTHQIERVVENVTTHTFGYDIVGGGYFNEDNKNIHLWTIQDAKDGDVLASGHLVFIFKVIHGVWINCHCSAHNDGSFIADSYDLMTNKYFSEVHPATKEQRDTLTKAMANAGWEFDFDKKELRKIEQNLASSAKNCKNDTLLDLLNKMPSCITVDGIDYHFVLKKTIAYMAFYEGEGEGSGKVIFWMAGDPVDLLTAMLNKLKEQGLLE